MPLTKVDKIYKIPGQLQWLVIDSSRNSCWVYFSKVQQRFKCRTQHPNNPGTPIILVLLLIHITVHRCHANAVAVWADKNMSGQWKPEHSHTSRGAEIESRFPLSHKAIPLVVPNKIRANLQTEKPETSPIQYFPEPELLPSNCQCDAKWKNYDEEYKVGRYYTVNFVKNVQVYCRKCVNNKCTWHFDGQSCGIFNYSGETLISYSLLHEFFNCCVRNGMSWSGFLDKTNHMYGDIFSMDDEKMQSMSPNTFSNVSILLIFVIFIK